MADDRPPCYVSDPLPRTPRADDCPHCHKSMWMGRNNARGCQCELPEVTHTAIFEGSAVEIIAPTVAGYSERTETWRAEIKMTMNRRSELFHFIRNLRFHLDAAEETLAKLDGAAQRQPSAPGDWPWEGENDDV